jgi:hypothetical protein
VDQDPDGGVDLDTYEGLLGDIRTCGRICGGVALYIAWLERNQFGAPSQTTPSESGSSEPSFDEFHRWLSGLRGDLRSRPIEDYVWPHELRARLERLAAISIYPVPADYDVALKFFGAYSQNPSVTRIVATGGAIGIVVLSLVFGTVQVMKEGSAPDCRAHYADLVQKQTEVFERSARHQGKWTPELRASHEAALKAINAASATCGSMLNYANVRINYAPEKYATARFGSSPD